MQVVTQQDVTSVISDLTKIVEDVKTNQYVVRKFKHFLFNVITL